MPEPGSPSTSASRWVFALTALWITCAVGGLYVLWTYENAPGVAANAPGRWPADSSLRPATDRPTVVFLAHPQCTCTRASLGELAEAIARAEIQPKTYVVFLRPSAFADGWEKSGLWDAATALPNTTVLTDVDGREAARFGAATSGQTFVYGSTGELLFSGGITGSRAHPGDNAGRASVVALLNHLKPERTGTNVFGCSLFSSAK